MLKLGQVCCDRADKWVGMTQWRTNNFLGNSGRSPIFPYRKRPWQAEIEERNAYEQETRKQKHEIYTTNRLCQFYGSVHPQRETCDYGEINDALFHADLDKLLEEQRHEMAIDCVQKGVYKDVIEAKGQQRDKRIMHSDYKYKHLLYRE